MPIELPMGFKQLCLNSSDKVGGVYSAVDDSAVGIGGACHLTWKIHCRIPTLACISEIGGVCNKSAVDVRMCS